MLKSQGLIRNQADQEQSEAYAGATAAILLIGLHQALKYSDNIKLRLSHPNNLVYKKHFMDQMRGVLTLVRNTLTDANGKGFEFSSVEYIDEASCNIAAIQTIGINKQLGSMFANNLASDMGGSTTDVSVSTFGNKRILLPAIPIAGRTVTLSSLVQVARGNGLNDTFRDIREGMNTVIQQQINPVIRKLLNQGVDTRSALEQMVHEPELAEAMQTLLDYFPLKLNDGKSQLLQSLVCMKELLLQDMILRQASRFYTEADLEAGELYLLRLGNGSRSVSLICGDKSPYNKSWAVLEQVLQDRAAHYVGKTAQLALIHNEKPKTEVSNGLACFDEQIDATIEHWQDDVTVSTPKELKALCLDAAIQRTMELAAWLGEAVTDVCGDIHPHHSGLDGGFAQLLKGLDNKNQVRVALCDTILHERGRFGSIYRMSAAMGTDVWVFYTLTDHVNRALAAAQAEQMKKGQVTKK